MKTKEIQRFIKAYLLSSFPNYAVTGSLLFDEPSAPILRAFCFEDSEFNTRSVFVWVFVQPLYIPKPYVYFTFGRRLTRKTGFLKTRDDWDIGSPLPENVSSLLLNAIKSQGIPYLARLASPELIIRNLISATGLRGDPYVLEAIAYSRARIGDIEQAERQLKKLLRKVRGDQRYQELTKRGEELITAIHQGAAPTANLLDRWTKATAEQLKLPSTS